MTKQNADYGYDIQRLYLEMMLSDAETFARCHSIFDTDLANESALSKSFISHKRHLR